MDYIPLTTAKQVIIDALNSFDTELGRCAAQILFDDMRANIVEEKHPVTQMMQCRPSGVSPEDLIGTEYFIPDFEKRYGPNFITRFNPEDFAIVDYEYVGTLDSIRLLAHEVGHAIADDMQRDKELSFRDFDSNELEEQAYFVQRIFDNYIEQHGNKYGIDEKMPACDKMLTSWQRAVQSKLSNQTFERISKLPPALRSREITKVLSEPKEYQAFTSIREFEQTNRTLTALPPMHTL